MKSGEGFRKWTPEQQAALRARVLKHLKAMDAGDPS
jgi:3-hydroxybutyryl-CoA dehydrogenase